MNFDRSLYPFASHFLDRRGLRLHYLDEGSGDPVVMVHGNPTWSFYYRNLVLALRDRARCIVPDHIGCGMSDKPLTYKYDFSLQSRIDDFTALMEHVEPTRPISLVMHDWGGMIGMAWAVRHPERVARLVVLNTAAFHLPKTKRFPCALWIGRNTMFGEWVILQRNAFCRQAARVGTKRRPLPRNVRDGLLAPYDTPEHRLAVLKFVQTIPLRPGDSGYSIVDEVQQGLTRLKDTPMFIGWGLKDFVFDRHFLAEWRQRFPDAEVAEYPDCGHYVLEDAAEELIPRIAHFLVSPNTKAGVSPEVSQLSHRDADRI